MTSTENRNWHEANQNYLMAALDVVRDALERHANGSPDSSEMADLAVNLQKNLQVTADAMPGPPALDMLCERFGLSAFERDVLLLCVGVELDASVPALCATAQGDPQRSYPTFGLALAAFPVAHWSAISPARPLRHQRFVEVGTGAHLTVSPLRIDERVLHYLTGTVYLDERLAGFVESVKPGVLASPEQPGIESLVPSHRALAEQIAVSWSQAVGKATLPVVQLCGNEAACQRAIAATASAMLALDLHLMPAQVIPLDPRELENMIRLWEREAVLTDSALLLECGEMDTSDSARESAIKRLIERLHGILIVSGRERRSVLNRTLITLDVRKPTIGEQHALWTSTLGTIAPNNLNGKAEALVSQFNLSPPTIAAVCAETVGRMAAGDDGTTESPYDFGDMLWDACRAQARPRLEDLARRIDPVATWDELVLPEAQVRTARELATHVRQRMKVYETWGFAAKSSRGLGISALFAGVSGTGKTMAAEVLANELRLDLYHIDLSQVVSKYIGETEKNIRRVFDAAEGGGAILLFDEADALFGKRSEVKDSHDRHANIEVSYLLQRMEAYRGLAILTTNMKDALDTAFLRRIRFIVQFPFPNPAERARIWERIFPADTPTEGLEVEKLARLNVAGGNIRNIAMNAAFLAADAGEPLRMPHLLRAARSEYTKIEKQLTDAEIKGWI